MQNSDDLTKFVYLFIFISPQDPDQHKLVNENEQMNE